MNEFLEYIRRRKAALRKELADLEVAEKVYLDSGAQLTAGQQALFAPTGEARLQKKPIKEMVVEILAEVQPLGLTALEILDRIHTRWNAPFERTSLSPQLTRLKNDGKIVNERGVWKLAKETGASADTEAPANGD